MSYALAKRLFISFKQLLKQISKDAMLFIACFAPILCGLFFQFGIPFVEKLLTKQFHLTEILSPYYLIFDIILAVITPLMLCFIAAMVILGEIDDNVANYMVVTPLGKSGYLVSRLGIPMVIAFAMTLIVLPIFSLTKLSVGLIIGISILTSLIGFIISMLVISISTNKVEGMAVTKLSGIFIVGIPVPFFVTENVQYLLAFLPSFWLSKFAMESKIIYLLFGIITSIGWILLLLKRFIRKMI
jgi:fluoroquinolone transport system permease protein